MNSQDSHGFRQDSKRSTGTGVGSGVRVGSGVGPGGGVGTAVGNGDGCVPQYLKDSEIPEAHGKKPHVLLIA